MLSVKCRGEYKKTLKKLQELSNLNITSMLNSYGLRGVEALCKSTPVDTGLTASSWYYEVTNSGDVYTLSWGNTNVKNGYANIAVLLDVGHGTATGGYVSGQNYINPSLQPIIDELKAEIWAEVTDK